jgi:hypothetical protein
MIKKGEKITRNGVVLAIANRDLVPHQARMADDLLLPDGSLPQVGERMPEELVKELEERGMYPY